MAAVESQVRKSFLCHLDPRTKLLLSLLFTIVIFFVNHLLAAAVFAAGSITLWCCAKMSLKKIWGYIKFLSVINPLVSSVIRVVFSKLSIVENGYKVSVLVCDETTEFAKLSLQFENL